MRLGLANLPPVAKAAGPAGLFLVFFAAAAPAALINLNHEVRRECCGFTAAHANRSRNRSHNRQQISIFLDFSYQIPNFWNVILYFYHD